MEDLEGQDKDFVGDTVRHWQPVKLLQDRCDVMGGRGLGYYSFR